MEIKFIASSKHVTEVRSKPQPASSFMPSWWKEMPMFSNGAKKLELTPYSNVTAKKCFPLLDSMTTGYIVTLWADILVNDYNGVSGIRWTTESPVVEAWETSQTQGYELPQGFVFPVYKYLHGWIIKTPPGYSCLITHPFGYPDLPIKTLTGIVDTDNFNGLANSPFVIQKGFEGIIEQGTPMFQIIPFKRDEWKAIYEEKTDEESFYERERFYSKITSRYGRSYRVKKSFE
jgi:hypothetical protein